MMALAYEMKRYQSLAAVFLLFKSSLGSMGTVFPFFSDWLSYFNRKAFFMGRPFEKPDDWWQCVRRDCGSIKV